MSIIESTSWADMVEIETKKRYEIDIIGVKGRTCLCVDCKEWSGGRDKKSGLKNAAKKMEKRVEELKKFLKKNSITDVDMDFYPIIVTLLEENLIKENDTLIIPASKLNSFLLEIETYT